MAELLIGPLDHVVGERVPELVGVDVRLAGGVPHEIREQPLDDPVLADHQLRPRDSGLGQECLLVLATFDEPFGFQPLQHLTGGCSRDAEHLGHPGGDRRRRVRIGPVLADREGEEIDRLQILVDRMSLTLRHRVSLAARVRADSSSSPSSAAGRDRSDSRRADEELELSELGEQPPGPGRVERAELVLDRCDRLTGDRQLVRRRRVRRPVRRLVVDRDQLERGERRLDVVLKRFELLLLRLRRRPTSPGRRRPRQRARARLRPRRARVGGAPTALPCRGTPT